MQKDSTIMLKFITGNKQKFKEVRELLKPIKVQQLNISLDEIQDIDPHKIMRHKLKEAFSHHKGPFIVEDSSLVMEAMGGKLPGPFIKFFNDFFGPGRLAELAIKTSKRGAKASVLIAYAKNLKQILFFESRIKGRIVAPKGKFGFGYDPIFQPQGSQYTLGQLKSKNNFSDSARGNAIKKLKSYLLKDQA